MLVRKLRLQKGWSQETLAELSGLSVRTIQRIERGQAAGAESLKALSSVFETDLYNLQGELTVSLNTPDIPAIFPSVALDEALAMAQVQRLRRFYNHAIMYLIVNAGLVAFNLLTQPRVLWFIFPMMGWGIGLLSHGLRAFEVLPFLDSAWEKRQIEKRLGRKL